jgi:CheY-like chemotaxis protein
MLKVLPDGERETVEGSRRREEMTGGSESETMSRPVPSVEPPEGPRRTHILLADDDDEMRSLLATTLRRDGYEVEEAVNGADLLVRIARSLLDIGGGRVVRAPDLVITDVRMPGFTGLEVLAALRDKAPKVPVIVITAFGDLETHQEAMQLGASAMFDKPFDLEDLRVAALNLAPPR